MVIIRQAEEATHFLQNQRFLPVLNGRNFPLVHTDHALSNTMVEEHNFLLPEHALGFLQVQLVLLHRFKNLLQMLLMLFDRFTVNNDVI